MYCTIPHAYAQECIAPLVDSVYFCTLFIMSLQKQVELLMLKNRRQSGEHQYTVPSPELYPFQWLWDSCFHAIILSHFDIEAAKAELRSACSEPLESGLLPHIIYWSHDTSVTNWGREMRGDIINVAWGVAGTSAITQPPIMGLAMWRVYEIDQDTSFLRELYAPLCTHYRHLVAERMLAENGLAFIINPDESGEDNSPRFDHAQNLPPVHTAEENLDRRIDRMRENVTCQFDAQTCMAKHFAVADVPFNILLAESLAYMGDIATVLKETDDAIFFKQQSDALNAAITSTLCDGGVCRSYDHNSEQFVSVNTWALFMPLYGGQLRADEADTLVRTWLLDTDHFWTQYPVPSTSCKDPSFDPDDGFWRGPVWMAPNWFIYHGLKRYGYDDLADELKKKTVALIELSGFREQYNPQTGEGQGATNFTWGGLAIDMN